MVKMASTANEESKAYKKTKKSRQAVKPQNRDPGLVPNLKVCALNSLWLILMPQRIKED